MKNKYKLSRILKELKYRTVEEKIVFIFSIILFIILIIGLSESI